MMSLRRLGLSLALLASVLALPASATAAEPAPAWSLKAMSYPTNFVQGTIGTSITPPGYLLSAVNVGGAPTAGTFTVSDVLPSGIVPQVVSGKSSKKALPMTCAISGQKVTCTGSEPLQPGERVEVKIAVKVVTSEFVSNEVAVSGGGAAVASVVTETAVTTQLPSFGFLSGAAGFSTAASNVDGSATTAAGSHPYQLKVDMGFPSVTTPAGIELLSVGGGIRDVKVDLPRGMVVNPGATPVRCTEVQLESNQCPEESQVGLITVTQSVGLISDAPLALYNMVPAPGSAGEFGFEVVEGVYAHLRGSVRSDGEYQLSAATNDIPAKLAIEGVETVLWGSPSDSSHDAVRGACLDSDGPTFCPIKEPRNTAFLSMPSSCGGPLTTVARADSWEAPGAFVERSAESTDLNGNPIGNDGCNQVDFSPTIEARPTTDLSDAPSGLEFNLHLPQRQQEQNPEGIVEANLKDATVSLPSGPDGQPFLRQRPRRLLGVPDRFPRRQRRRRLPLHSERGRMSRCLEARHG